MTQKARPEDPDSVREMVSDGYARIAKRSKSGCCSSQSTNCCGPTVEADRIAQRIGYSADELGALPEGANLGLGCGNPTAIDSLRAGEVVLDLGSGAGIDVLIAAKKVGPAGRVIGVDMTDAMLEKARKNAGDSGYQNVEFRKGTIEALPVEDESVDVIISNCVINLSPEKNKVFREAHRVLKPGGRMLISDIVLDKELPPEVLSNVNAWVGCVGGASLRSNYLQTIADAGFSNIRVDGATKFSDSISPNDPSAEAMAADYGIAPDKVRDVLDAVTSLQLFVRK